MDLGLQGKTALITAASRGLGFAAALALAREGATVAICSRDESAIRQASATIQTASGHPACSFRADLSDKSDCERLAGDVLETLGSVDIFVSNTGGPKPGAFLDLEDRDWQTAGDLVLMSALRLTRALVPGMLKRNWGRIVYLASMSAKQPIPGLVLSNANRAALLGYAKTQAAEWGPHRVTVNCVCPGFFLTGRMQALYAADAEMRGVPIEQILAEKTRDIPAGRLGNPEELAAVIAFLCSEQAGYVNGACIQVDGGLIKGLF